MIARQSGNYRDWYRQRPIDISKIRAAALFLIMPNGEHRVALPHGKQGASGVVRSAEATVKEWHHQMSGAQQRLYNKTSHAGNPLT